MGGNSPMNNLVFYLAEPIDFGQADPVLVDFARGWLDGMKINTYRPKSAWAAYHPDPRVQQANQTVLDTADALVAFLPSVDTVGVPAEIAHALARRTPVLIVTDRIQSFVVRGWTADPLAFVIDFSRESINDGLGWLLDTAVDQKGVKKVAKAVGLPSVGNQRGLIFEPVHTTDPDAATGTSSHLPTRGYPDDAGFDLYVSVTTSIPKDSFVDVPCGVKVDLPQGVWGFITGRSSSLRKHGLLVSTGIIDTGYTGPLFAGVHNLAGREVIVHQGDRIAQLIPLPAVANYYRPVWGEVSVKSRGDRGFGSSGV